MPPGQPIRRCQECGLHAPVKAHTGNWFTLYLCRDCSPLVDSDEVEA